MKWDKNMKNKKRKITRRKRSRRRRKKERETRENRYARHTGTSFSGEGRDATSASTRVPGANADDSSFLASVGYFWPATIFEGDSSRGFAAVLVRVCARWPAQRHRPPHLCRETRWQRSRFAGIWDPRTASNSSSYIRLDSDQIRPRKSLIERTRKTILIWNGLDSTKDLTDHSVKCVQLL